MQKKRFLPPICIPPLPLAAPLILSPRPPRPGQSINAAASGNVRPRPPQHPQGESLVGTAGCVKVA